MTLRLEYPDKYQLWSKLIQGKFDRVFVETTDSPRLATRVPVELALSGLQVHVVITGVVIGARTRSDRFPAGVYVRFDEEEMEKCRRFLGLAHVAERYEQGRKARRAACELSVVLRQPPLASPGVVRDLSEVGLLLDVAAPLSLGQFLQLAVTLDDGTVLELRGEVSRQGPGSLLGVRFISVEPEVARALDGAVTRLSTAVSTAPTPCLVVADDAPEILEMLTKVLSRFGYEIHKARRGDEAITLVRELKPAMLILDILMPGIDGMDICKMMRADVELSPVPVIFVSALEPERLHQLADEAGATDYLTKPLQLSDLINLVGRYLK